MFAWRRKIGRELWAERAVRQRQPGKQVEGNTEQAEVSGYEDTGAQGCRGLLPPLNVGALPKGGSMALTRLQQSGW